MALQNDPRMFTGGAVVFNTNPTLQFQAQQLAKKQAKEEALNKYFDDQLKSLNTEGLRPQDLRDVEGKGRGILDRIENWRKTWVENKESILKGGDARLKSDMELQDIRSQIGQAKAAGSFFNELGKARAEGKYDPDEDEMKILDHVTKPVYDPNYRKQDGTPYGWADVAPVVPEFDAKKQNEFWLSSTKGLQPGKQYEYDKLKVNDKTGQAIVPFKEVYSPGQIKAIAENAGQVAMNDKSIRKHYNKILDNPQSEEWTSLNKAYQSVFGTDKIVSTPEQAAQADAIIRASVPVKEGQEQEVNYAQRLLDRKMMTAFNSALIASRSQQRQEQGKTTGNVLNDFPDTDFGNMKIVGGVWYNADGTPRTKPVFLKGQYIPSSVRSVLKSGGIDEGALNMGVNVEFENGQIKSISNKGIGTVTRQAVEKLYQPKFDTERKGENMNFPSGGNYNTVSINDIPAGTKLEQKKGKYYYKGKEVIF